MAIQLDDLVARLRLDTSGIGKGLTTVNSGLTSLGKTSGRVALAAGAGLGAAIAKAADFDSAMSNVEAATHESAANMELLRKAALKAGADTVFSATESASAIEELSKAGVATTDILDGGLSGALDLAAAGGLDVAEAAETAASAMTQFSLSGDKVPHIADLLAAGAGKAQGSVHDLGMALGQTGLVAAQTGLSIEETTGGLAAFASAGLTGSDAGTSFKTMLLALTPTSKTAQAAMDGIGFSAFDAQGKFIGLEGVAGKLRAGLANMSAEQRNATLKQIFGNDAVRAANVLYEQGATGIAEWTNKVNDTGYAADTAATRLDNLRGDVEQLKGSLETALIGTGEGAQGPLRSLTQNLTKVVNAYNDLSDGAKSAVAKTLGVTAALAGGLYVFVKVVKAIDSTRKSLKALGIDADAVPGKLGKVATAFGSVLLAAQAANAIVDTLDLSNSINVGDLPRDLEAISRGIDTTSLDKLSGALEGVNEAGAGTVSFATNLATLGTFTSSFERNSETIEAFDQQLASLVESGNAEAAAEAFQRIRDAAAAHGGVSDADVVKRFDAYKTALGNVADTTGDAADATHDYAQVQEQAARAVSYSADQIKAARKAYAEQLKSARDSASGFIDISKSADKAKVSLNDWIRQMSRQAAALEEFTANARKAADRGLRQGLIAALEDMGPAGALRMKQLANATDEQIDRANRAWKRGQQAIDDYTKATVVKPVELRADASDVRAKVDLAKRKFDEMPKSTNTQLKVDNNQALAGARAVQAALDRLHDKTITLRTQHMDIRLERGSGGGGDDNGNGRTGEIVATATRDATEQTKRNLIGITRGLFDGIAREIGAVESDVASDVGKLLDRIQQEYADRSEAAEKRISKHIEKLRKDAQDQLDAAEKTKSKKDDKAAQAALDALDERERKRLQRARERYRELSKAAREAVRGITDSLTANARAQDEVNAKLDVARDKLSALQEQARTFAEGVRQSFEDYGNVVGLGVRQVGDKTTVTITDLLADLKKRVENAARFAQLISQLTAQGLSQGAIQNLLAAGVEGGLATAEAIAEGGADGIEQINELTAQLTDLGTQLGSELSSTFYGAGISAAQSVVDGLILDPGGLNDLQDKAETLTEQLKTALGDRAKRKGRDVGHDARDGLVEGLEDGDQLSKAGRRVAHKLVEAFRDELGIHSPSRVMFAQTRLAGIGAVDGLDSMLSDVAAASARLADAATIDGSQLLQMRTGFASLPGVGLGASAAAAQPISVRVFIGDRELTDIVDVQIDNTLKPLRTYSRQGVGIR